MDVRACALSCGVVLSCVYIDSQLSDHDLYHGSLIWTGRDIVSFIHYYNRHSPGCERGVPNACHFLFVDSFVVLIWGAFVGSLVAILLVTLTRLLTLSETIESWLSGVRYVLQQRGRKERGDKRIETLVCH